MSEKTDTPITDQFQYYFSNHDSCAGESIYTVAGDRDVTWDDSYSGYSVPSRVARDIERQLAEATAQYGRLLDELMTERDTAIEQLDRLAEALRECCKRGANPMTEYGYGNGKPWARMADDIWRISGEALATLDRKEGA